ncbi:MAG: class I SAM-dependent methyltransferase [Cyanobacteria bacterium P01_D01_bin.105]
MSSQSMSGYRQQLLKDVSGDVLEIGFGTGLNVPHYPDAVTSLTAIDPNQGMNSLAQKRLRESPLKITTIRCSGENLALPNASFDNVVCTWTLCSIPDADKALREAYRVLKPGGQFFFIEHGLSNEASIQTWQNRITPVQKIIADGCHLNRKMDALVRRVFDQVRIDEFYAEALPKVIGYFYSGIATKHAVTESAITESV